MWASCHSGLLTQLLYHLFRVCLWVKGSSKTHWLSGLSQMSPAVSSTLQSSTEASRSGTRAGPLAFALKHAHPRGPQITSLLTKVAEGFSSPSRNQILASCSGERARNLRCSFRRSARARPYARVRSQADTAALQVSCHCWRCQQMCPISEANTICTRPLVGICKAFDSAQCRCVSASCQPACKAHMLQPYHARAWDLLLVSADGSVQMRDGHYRRDAAPAI